MCARMVDIQSATAEVRRGRKRKKKKAEDRRNHRMKIMSASATQGGHNKADIYSVLYHTDLIILEITNHKQCDENPAV